RSCAASPGCARLRSHCVRRRRMPESWSTVSIFERALDFPPHGFACDRFPFVVQLLAFGESDFNFRAAVLEVDLQRDDRVPAFPHASPQAIDLAAVKQQLARARFLVAELPRPRVGAGMGTATKQVGPLHARGEAPRLMV